MKWLKHGSF